MVLERRTGRDSVKVGGGERVLGVGNGEWWGRRGCGSGRQLRLLKHQEEAGVSHKHLI